MNEHLIAVVADSQSGDEQDVAIQKLVLAAVTAILEHGGRVLLSADAAVRIPALYTAAEYVAPVEVESAERRSAVPIIIAPFPDDESIEERLFTTPDASDDDRAEGASRTLLSELIHAGIAEQPERKESDTPPRTFDDLLRTLVPTAVLVIGNSERAEKLQDAAVRYHLDEGQSRLVRLDRPSSQLNWQSIDERVERFRTPPRFEGELVEDRVSTDDGLWRIAMRASEDAARVLAIEELIAEILGDIDSIAPNEYEPV